MSKEKVGERREPQIHGHMRVYTQHYVIVSCLMSPCTDADFSSISFYHSKSLITEDKKLPHTNFLTPSLIGSNNCKVHLLTNQQVVFMGVS